MNRRYKMLLGFMKNRITEAGSDPMSEIEIMLESTWDLTMTHSVKNEVPEARAVNAFNNFFKKLNRTITSLLRNIVALAALAPELTAFSKTFRQLAGEQDVKVSDIAEAGDRITLGIEDISTSTGDLNQKFTAMKVDVETAMNQGKLSMTGFNEIKSQVSILVDTIRVLRENSASIGSISDTINAISDETNILSLNARIEAARGQSDGKGFKVIAEEVGLLAKQSKAATNDIKARLELLGEKIAATITAVETVEQHVAACERQILDANISMDHVYSQFIPLSKSLDTISCATQQQAKNIEWITFNIDEIKASARHQTADVNTILTIADRVASACDGMVTDAGGFHISGHGSAKAAALEMARNTDIASGKRNIREKTLMTFLDRFPFVELAYVTDMEGRQVISNIYAKTLAGRKGLTKGIGSDWSAKEWFTKALSNNAPFISKVYRSSATREFCFTVSLPLRHAGGNTVGVLGIDVNFRDILEI